MTNGQESNDTRLYLELKGISVSIQALMKILERLTTAVEGIAKKLK